MARKENHWKTIAIIFIVLFALVEVPDVVHVVGEPAVLERGPGRDALQAAQVDLLLVEDGGLLHLPLLDTFDALSPTYDLPNDAATVQRWFADAGLSARLTRRNPIVVVGIKNDAQLVAS